LWSCNERGSDVSRLKDLVAQAAAVAPRQAAKIEERARRLIASEAPLEELQNESFGMHEALLAEGEGAMHDLKHTLAPLTNSPPSKTSDGSQQKSEVDPPAAPLKPDSAGAESGR